MRTCNTCGFESPDSFNFCSNCGTNLGGVKNKIAGIKAKAQHNLSIKVREIKESLDNRISNYIEKIDTEQELLLGDVHVPNKRRDTIRSTLVKFQNNLNVETQTTKEFDEWLEDLDERLEEENCIVCFQKWTTNIEDIVVCKYCQTGGHRLHLRDWVKNNKFCPLCRENIQERDLILLEL